tara:strand:- start:231 stop:689 length:459 start_codon:yes stop_codon:yes gene_type:complete
MLKMKAKNVESLRQKMGDTKVVRLLRTKPFIDDKWIDDPSKLKEYLVVRYKKDNDQYLPVWNVVSNKKVVWWESATHDNLKSKIKSYDDKWDRKKKDDEKKGKAKFMLKNKGSFKYFHTDDFKEANLKYVEWLNDDDIEMSENFIGKTGVDD